MKKRSNRKAARGQKKENGIYEFIANMDINLLTIILLLIVANLVIMIGALTGYTIAGQPSLTTNISWRFEKDNTKQVTLQNQPTSLRITGRLIGNGTATIYLLTPERNLIASVSPPSDSGLEGVTGLTSANITNSAPLWLENLNNISIEKNTNATINLSSYFADPDEDTLTYVATGPDNIDVFIYNELVTLTPEENFTGQRDITFIASDSEYTTSSSAIDIIVSGSETTIEEEPIKPIITEFENLCEETCTLADIPNNIEIEIQLDNAILEIDSITYTYEEEITGNLAPVFLEIPAQTVYKNSNLTINLSDYCYDPNKDNITYLATGPEHISVFIYNNLVTLTPEIDWTGEETISFIASDSNLTSTSDEVMIQVIESPVENISTGEAIQTFAEINKPVKWKKSIRLNQSSDNIVVDITSEAKNIKVKKIENNQQIDINDKVKVNINGSIRNLKEITADASLITGALFVDIDGMASITGNIVHDIQNIPVNVIEDAELIVEDNASELEIEYYTDAPTTVEKDISSSVKQVIVSSDLPYKNILTYTQLTAQAPADSIKIYWLINNTKLDITDLPEFYVSKQDTDGDSLIDYIEWVTPHLSNQTFQIEITVLNVQSYPVVGGEWTVMFDTVGKANLTISASDSTTYTEMQQDIQSTEDDLEITQLRCNDTLLFDKASGISFVFFNDISDQYTYSELNNTSTDIMSLFIPDYECNSTSYFTVKVLTPGIHNQKFQFGTSIAYANNQAQHPPTTDIVVFADGNSTNTRYFE